MKRAYIPLQHTPSEPHIPQQHICMYWQSAPLGEQMLPEAPETLTLGQLVPTEAEDDGAPPCPPLVAHEAVDDDACPYPPPVAPEVADPAVPLRPPIPSELEITAPVLHAATSPNARTKAQPLSIVVASRSPGRRSSVQRPRDRGSHEARGRGKAIRVRVDRLPARLAHPRSHGRRRRTDVSNGLRTCGVAAVNWGAGSGEPHVFHMDSSGGLRVAWLQ
jgi:hypothetical protein